MLGVDEDNHHSWIYALHTGEYQIMLTKLGHATMRLVMYWYTVAAKASPSFRLKLAFTESRLIITCTTYIVEPSGAYKDDSALVDSRRITCRVSQTR